MAKDVSKADVDDKISTREGDAVDELRDDEAAVSTEFDLDEFREDGKLTATGLDSELTGSVEAVLTAEVTGKLPDPGEEAASLTVAGGAEGWDGSISGEGSITTTVVAV